MKVASAIITVAAVLSAGVLQAQAPRPPARVVESVALDTDSAVNRKLGAARDYLSNRQWDDAVGVIREVAEADGEKLIAVEPGRYVNVGRYCNMLLAALPPEGLAAYRVKVDPLAAQWWEEGRRFRDEALLRKIVRNAYVSSVGDDALFLLGDLAWDRGEIASARNLWTQALPVPVEVNAGEALPVLRYPDAGVDPALVLARLVLCSIVEGEHDRAVRELSVFRKKHPDATGALAGRDGNLAGILDEVLTASKGWRPFERTVTAGTFALNFARDRVLENDVDVGAMQWERRLGENLYPTGRRRRALRDGGPLSTHPLIAGDMVLVNDADRIYAYNLYTGLAYEPRPDVDQGQPEWLKAVVYPEGLAGGQTPLPSHPLAGVPRFTMTWDDGRLYAKMGTPITGRAEHELRELPSDLVCIDLENGFRLLWKESAETLFGRGWAFEGSPVVESGRVYIAVRKTQPQTQINIAAIDVESRKVVWNRRVCTAVFDAGTGRNLMTHLLLTLGDDCLFLSTDLGAVAAIETRDGMIRWAATYESRPPSREDELSDHTRRGLTPCVYHRGVVVTAANDSDSVTAWDARTGVVRWSRALPDERIRHLLGVAHNRVIATGNSIWAFDLSDGAVAWRQLSRDPEHFGYGRGLLAGDVVYWPKRQSIEVLNQRTGNRVREPIDLRTRGLTSASAGNLAAADGLLLIAQPRRLVALGESARVIPKWKDVISRNPSAPAPRFRLGFIYDSAGNFEAALDQYRAAIERAGPGDRLNDRPLGLLAREKLFALLMKTARRDLEQKRFASSIERLDEAGKNAVDAQGRVAALSALAGAHGARGDPADAVAAWQTILSDGDLAVLVTGADSTPAGQIARSEIAELIRQHGPGVYASFEDRARRELRTALERADADEVSRIIERFPNSQSSGTALLELARRHGKLNRPHDAVETYHRILENPESSFLAPVAALELAESYERLGYFCLARRQWKTLAGLPADVTIHRGGRDVPAAELAGKRLATEAYQQSEVNEPTLVPPFNRAWARTLPPNSRTIRVSEISDFTVSHVEPDSVARPIAPRGVAPGKSDCILLNDRGLSCIDVSSGRLRWSINGLEPSVWAGYAGPYLVVGTRSRMRAVTVETGEIRWEVPLLSEGAGPAEDGGEDAPQFYSNDELVVCLDSGRRVIAVSAVDGRVRWRFRPATGRLRSRWYCDDRHVLLEVESPPATLALSTEDGRQLADFGELDSHWTSPPVRIDDDRFAIVTADYRIRAVSISKNRVAWTYSGPSSHAFQSPALVSDGKRLLLIIDGDALSPLSPETGRPLWSRSLGAFPSPRAKRLVEISGNEIFTTADGVLRSIDLKDGRVNWESPLGASALRWRPAATRAHVYAVPDDSPHADDGRRVAKERAVVVFDRSTGRRIQRIAARGSSAPSGARFDPHTGVTSTDALLMRLSSWTAGDQ